MKYTLLLAAICLGLTQGQDYDEWIRSTNDLGVTIEFPCEDVPEHPKLNDGDSPISEGAVPESWMLPNLTIIDCGGEYGNVEVSADCSILTVNNVQRDDIGLYHCLIRQTNGDIFLVKWGLNARGPYFDDMWDKYQSNTVIALSSAGGFVLLVMATCLIYHNRYIPEKKRAGGSKHRSSYDDDDAEKRNGVDNFGYQGYGDMDGAKDRKVVANGSKADSLYDAPEDNMTKF